MDGAADDPSGKHHKPSQQQSRKQVFYGVLVAGVCLGFIASQNLYMQHQRQLDNQVPRRKLVQKEPRSELESILQRVAPEREVMIAISNYKLIREGMLTTWLEMLTKAEVPNYVVVAIDTQLRDDLTAKGYNVYYKDISVDASQEGTGDNHAISALKFKILQEFLELNWHVLLSDVDIVTLQNPFDHLYRDHDIEGMSDGFDQWTAYGKVGGLDDQSMGWARYAQGTEHLNMNSGLFYLRANERTLGLMKRIAARLSKEKAWDQSVYNQEIFFLSHDDYVAPHVTVRVMNIYKFMNSKVLFKEVRQQPRSSQVLPVMIHINYHPDKHARMLAVVKYYVDKDDHALEPFPGGSEPGS
ncbi:hypothetical protein WJX77_010367 [Trebouxia sp. C0004]